MNQVGERGPLVLLALDSADARLIEQWADEGYLPTIKGLLDRGVQSRLTGSEFVSENGIWISLLSGLNRAQHGYYYWRPLNPGTYKLKFSDQRIDHVVPFWGHLRDSQMRVAAIDVPESHCTAGISGVQVANWSPHNAQFKGYSVPTSFFRDLRRQFGAPLGTEEVVGGTFNDDNRIYNKLLKQIDQKAAICRHLLAHDCFDLVVIGFHEAHIAGHQFWKYSELASNPLPNSGRLKHATRDVYQAIDTMFGRVLDQLGRNSTAIVVSNMGIQEDFPNLELTQAFCRQLGYHRITQFAGPESAAPRLIRRLIPKSWQRAMSDRLPDGLHAHMLTKEYFGGTDWHATTLFPIPSYFLGLLRVNLRGREPQGVIEPGADYVKLLDRVEEDLKMLIDPKSGQPAVRSIARTVDLFQSQPHWSLPDIFFDWAPAPYPKRRIEHQRAVLEQNDLFFNRDTRHDLQGFFAAAGPSISGRGRLPNLSVLDIAPTCLRLMGQPIPEAMQGTVPSQMLD